MEKFQQRLVALFEDNPQLKTLRQKLVAGRNDAWLVGGCLRDMLLGLPVVDIDIATSADPTPLAQDWAETINARWFWLDAERLQSRVLLPNQLVVDFVPLRAATIGGDQNLRDFTINSLALPLHGELSRAALLDPLNAQQDLHARSLKTCSSRSLADDPLRMLKGVRHAISLQLQLDDDVLQQIRNEANSIQSIAAERIRDELGKILLAENPVAGFELLQETTLLPALFGSAGPGWRAADAFSDLKQFDQNMQAQQDNDDDEPTVNEPFSSRSLFLLATLLRCYQPTNLPDLLHRKLRLSRQQQRIIISLQEPLSESWLVQLPSATSARQQALLVEALGYFPAEQLIYWSLYRQLLPLDKVYALIEAYHAQQHMGRVPDLLDGNRLAQLGSISGKEIGNWQQKIKQAELAGEVVDAESAVSWLESKISN